MIVTSLLSVLSSVVFHVFQLVVGILKPNSTTHSIVLSVMWSTIFIVALMAALVFVFKRKELLSIFEKWKQLEAQLVPVKVSRSSYNTYYRSFFSIYVVAGLALPFVSLVVAFTDTEASFLLSHYPVFRDTLTIPGIMFYHTVTACAAWVFVGLSDFVPSWTFYHAGLALEYLAAELEIESKGLNIRMARIQLCYGNLYRLVRKANELFGIIVAFNHAFFVVVICVLFYTVASTIREFDWDTLIYFCSLILFVWRMIMSDLMASHVYSSSVKLRATLSKAICTEELMEREERKKAQRLLIWMSHASLSARPLNLFSITPSSILTVSSLIISYVIVLLQTK